MPRSRKGETNGGLALAEVNEEDIAEVDTAANETEGDVEAGQESEPEVTAEVSLEPAKTLAPPTGPAIEYRDDPTTARIAELAQEAKDYEDAENDYKEKAKAAKANKEKAISEMRRLGLKYNQPTMFDRSPSEDSISACPPPFGAEEGGTAVMEKPKAEDWRNRSVMVLVENHGLPGRTADALIDAGLETLGKVADYTSRGKLLTGIKGVSQAGFEKYLEADTEFWVAYKLEQHDPDDPANDEPFDPENESQDDTDSEE